MPGGEIHLTFKGAQDLYLTDNPQISYFKSVYKRYTNFAMEVMELDLNGNSFQLFSSSSNERKLSFKIPRNGDLLHYIYLTADIPDVESTSSEQFQWIRRLGEYLIKEITIVGGDSRVYNKITSEYLHVYAETKIPESKINAYNEMIGNVPEMYDPANANSNNGIYPNGSNNVPSIRGRKLTIPIPFWFCLTSGNALPLVAIQKMEFRIDVTLRRTEELFTVINNTADTASISTSTFRKRVRPSDSKVTTFANNNSSNLLNCFGNFIFLDKEERKRFALTEHKYLMTQYHTNNSNSYTSSNINLELTDFNHPIQQIYVLLRFIHNENANQWSNYTVWEYGPNGKLESPDTNNFVSEFVKSHYTLSNPQYYKNPDILDTLEIQLNSDTIKNSVTYSEYFKNINPYFFNNCARDNNSIYSYSYGIDNKKNQPSGSLNYSRIQNKNIIIKKKDNITSEVRLIVIAENINFFRVLGGMAGTEFEN